MTTTPNMGLILPDPQVTAGPNYASLNDAAFQAIDSHDHSAGSGVPVPTSGININASLDFNGWNGFGFRSVRMEDQPGTLTDTTDIGCIYVKNGELAYRDLDGVEVVLTANGSVAGATGTITGLVSPASASFSGVANTFAWLFDTAKPARQIMADLQLYPYDGTTAFANFLTIKAPTTLATNFSWTLPNAASSQGNVLSISTAGQIAYGIADGTVGAPSIAFSLDLDTGLYRAGTGDVRFAADGANVGGFSAGGIKLIDGSSGTPSISFLSDTDLGLYRVGANQLGLAASQTLFSGLGSPTVPALAFAADTNTGIYSPGADTLGLTVAGSLALYIKGGGVETVNGSAAAPSYSFSSDPDTGIYRVGANQLGIATGGSNRVTVSSSGLATASGTGIDAGGGANYIKWAVFTGTLTNTTPVTLSVSPGVVLGAVGWAYGELDGDDDAGMQPIGYFDNASVNHGVVFQDPSPPVSGGIGSVTYVKVKVENFVGQDRWYYRVLVFYI